MNDIVQVQIHDKFAQTRTITTIIIIIKILIEIRLRITLLSLIHKGRASTLVGISVITHVEDGKVKATI